MDSRIRKSRLIFGARDQKRPWHSLIYKIPEYTPHTTRSRLKVLAPQSSQAEQDSHSNAQSQNSHRSLSYTLRSGTFRSALHMVNGQFIIPSTDLGAVSLAGEIARRV
jgi:hypothetical protein